MTRLTVGITRSDPHTIYLSQHFASANTEDFSVDICGTGRFVEMRFKNYAGGQSRGYLLDLTPIVQEAAAMFREDENNDTGT